MLSRLSRFASLALVAAVLSVTEGAYNVSRTIVLGVRTALVALRDWAYVGLENLHQTPAGEISSKPTVARVKAHAFVARLLKRDRPHVTSGWRMCPST